MKKIHIIRKIRIIQFMNAKESAQLIINQLPEQASWNDIMYELYVKQKIETGLKAVAEGRTIPHNQIKARIPAKHHKPA